MVVPSERTFDLFRLDNRHFVGYRIALDDADGITQELVAIFHRHVSYIERIFRPIYQFILRNVDAVVLDVGELDRVFLYVPNGLCDVFLSAARTTYEQDCSCENPRYCPPGRFFEMVKTEGDAPG